MIYSCKLEKFYAGFLIGHITQSEIQMSLKK